MENSPTKLNSERVKLAMGNKERFYFTCDTCGKCCSGGGNVYFSKEEVETLICFLKEKKLPSQAILKSIRQGKKNGLLVHDVNKACFFLKDNLCTIYPVRPLQCRTFPFWPSLFENKQIHRLVQTVCHGFHNPDADTSFTPLQIVRRCNQTHKNFLKCQSESDEPLEL